MKKSLRAHLAILLALALVIAGGIAAGDSRLKASDENVYEDSAAEPAPVNGEQELMIDISGEEEPSEEVSEETASLEEGSEETEAAEEPVEESEVPEETAEEPEPIEESAEEHESLEEGIVEPEIIEEVIAEPEIIEEVIAEPETLEEAAAEPEPAKETVEEPEANPERSVVIVCSIGKDGTIYFGDTVCLTAVLNGFDGLELSFQWTYLDTTTNKWIPISGETGISYSFTASAESLERTYNISVSVIG